MSVAINKVFTWVDGFFERLLKILFPARYPLQPIIVEKAIERAIVENTKVFKNGALPPNRIRVLMNQEDYADFKKIEKIFRREIEMTAVTFIENGFKEQSMGISRPVISVETEPGLTKGEVRVAADHNEATYEEPE